VTIPVECTTDENAVREALCPAWALPLQPSVSPPDLVLIISTHEQPRALQMTLLRDGCAWSRTFPPMPLRQDPASFVASYYAQLDELARSSDPATREVQVICQNLWKELIPQELKDLYARERASWRGRSLLIHSDDPHLPWELVWPYGTDWQDEMPWCCTMGLTRWLGRDAQGNGNEGPPAYLSLGALAVAVPADTNLPAARKEQEELLKLARGHNLRDVSPQAASRDTLRLLLEAGEYDWLHLGTHGKFNVSSPEGRTSLLLEEGKLLTPADFVGPKIEKHIRQRRPGFFFNACEVGRQSWGLSRLAGCPMRLVSAGAGLFVGPLWEVGEEPAQEFALAFYEGLLAGLTVAGAVREARLRARRKGGPTWLAYSVYGHPNARLARLGTG
jgi:hypothetical protein